MGFAAMLIDGLWAGLFAGGMGVLLTVPSRFIARAFLCGFAGRFARDAFMRWGVNQNWSTVVAAAVVALVAVAITRRDVAVVLVSGVLPLGAAVAVFNSIILLMKVSLLTGEALNGAVVALSANLGKVFTTTLAIALGLTAGMALAQFLRPGGVREGT